MTSMMLEMPRGFGKPYTLHPAARPAPPWDASTISQRSDENSPIEHIVPMRHCTIGRPTGVAARLRIDGADI